MTFVRVFLISLGSMFFGAITGGVGLILRPMLIFLGFPIVNVVGTVRFTSIFGEIPAIILLHKHKRIDWKLVWFLVFPMFIGSLIASIAVVSVLKGKSIEYIIGIVMLIVGIILLFQKKIMKPDHVNKSPLLQKNIIGFFGTMILSFFNTISGGLLPLFTSFYIFNYNKNYTEGSALGKVSSYIGAGVASLSFLFTNVIDRKLFFVVLAGVLLGSYFGALYGLKRGDKWIKIIVLIVIFASALKFLLTDI